MKTNGEQPRKANGVEPRSYMFGNTRHEIYTHADTNRKNDWTVIVGEDTPRVYSSILEQWTTDNLVGRGITVDLADESGFVGLLTMGRAQLGDSDASVAVEGINPELTIVILDIKDDRPNSADEFRGLNLADRIAKLVEGRLVHVTVHPQNHLASDPTVAGRHELNTVFTASKNEDGGLTSETRTRLTKLVENLKARFGPDQFVVQQGQSFKIVYKTPSGKIETSGWRPATPPVLAMHWALARKEIPLCHLAMFCGLGEAGERRRNQEQMFQEFREWTQGQSGNEILDGEGNLVRHSAKERTTRTQTEHAVRIRKEIEKQRDQAASEMETASHDIAVNLGFNLFAVSAERGEDISTLKHNAQVALARIKTDTELEEWLGVRNRSVSSKAAHLCSIIKFSTLTRAHLLKLENHVYVEMLNVFFNHILHFADHESDADQAFQLYSAPDIFSDDGFSWISRPLKQKYAERKAVYDSHHNTWTIANEQLQPDWQKQSAEHPERKHPLKEPVEKLRKDFIAFIKRCKMPELAQHFGATLFFHKESIFYSNSTARAVAWKLSPPSGPIPPSDCEDFNSKAFYKLWINEMAASTSPAQ